MKVFPKITTPHCVLDSIRMVDVPILNEIFEDGQTKIFLPEIYELIDAEYGVQRFISAFEHFLENEEGVLWGVCKNDMLIGFVAAMDLTEKPTIFYATHPHHRLQGYMKEAISHIIDYFKNTLQYQQISTDVYKNNEVSLSLLKHLGFRIIEEDDGKIYMSINLA